MAKYDSFEELPVWKEAARLYNQVLDLLSEPKVRLSPGYRNQLDRAALSVSNNIAEGFERATTSELLNFLAIARGSAGEVRSMLAVIASRPEMAPADAAFQTIRATAQSCSRQIMAWSQSIENSPVKGKRYLSGKEQNLRNQQESVKRFRLEFLRSLKPEHPLYNTPEARAARGENPD